MRKNAGEEPGNEARSQLLGKAEKNSTYVEMLDTCGGCSTCTCVYVGGYSGICTGYYSIPEADPRGICFRYTIVIL